MGRGGGAVAKAQFPFFFLTTLGKTHMCTQTLKGVNREKRERERKKCHSYEPQLKSELTGCGLSAKQAVTDNKGAAESKKNPHGLLLLLNFPLTTSSQFVII